MSSPIEKQFAEALMRLAPDPSAITFEQYPSSDSRLRIDFAMPSVKRGVELDGFTYHEGQGREKATADKARERELDRLGWKITRFSGDEVRTGANACAREWLKLCGYSNWDLQLAAIKREEAAFDRTHSNVDSSNPATWIEVPMITGADRYLYCPRCTGSSIENGDGEGDTLAFKDRDERCQWNPLETRGGFLLNGCVCTCGARLVVATSNHKGSYSLALFYAGQSVGETWLVTFNSAITQACEAHNSDTPDCY